MHAQRPASRATQRRADDESAPSAVLLPLAQVARREGLASLAERLLALRAWLADDLGALEMGLSKVDEEAALAQAGPTSSEQVAGTRPLHLPQGSGTERAVRHLLELPGKRIRPLCVLLASRLGDADVHKARQVAMACELVHAATLLHDDVVDDSTERRGAKAARVVFGNSASILAGDHLLVHALLTVHEVDEPALLRSLLQVMRRMVRGEALQLERRGSFSPSREAYLEVIRGKTAALFGWGLSAGATLAHLPAAERCALERAGLHLGMAFQLVDDVLDIEGDPYVTGKAALQDVREGKLTWPLILASERDESVLANLVEAARRGREMSAPAMQQLLERIRNSGAIEDTRAYARAEAQAASEALASLPPSRGRESLLLVVHSAVHRLA